MRRGSMGREATTGLGRGGVRTIRPLRHRSPHQGTTTVSRGAGKRTGDAFRSLLGVATVLLVVASQSLPSSAATSAPLSAGDLDPSFGGDGVVITDVGGYGEAVLGLALQPDGRIVAVGWANTRRPGSALVRYLPDGTPDPTFGSGGIVVDHRKGGSDSALDVVLQTDGRIVTAGYAWVARRSRVASAFIVTRYLSDGTIDPSFGVGGAATTEFEGYDRGAYAIASALQTDGKIVVAGNVYKARAVAVAVARYLPDGSPDPAFGVGGEATFPVVFSAADMALQPDGNIIVAGTTWRRRPTLQGDLSLIRILPDGSLDTTFGDGGLAAADLGANEAGYAVAIQPDGRILSAGVTVEDNVSSFAFARHLVDGDPDLTFGDSGVQSVSFDGGAYVTAVAIDEDGRIVAVGIRVAGVGANDDFALARLLSDGSLDSAFGASGRVVSDLGGGDEATDVLIQPDGNIVVGGRGGSDELFLGEFALARYLGS
jgi:uncharacterized delta-60 repeat protein